MTLTFFLLFLFSDVITRIFHRRAVRAQRSVPIKIFVDGHSRQLGLSADSSTKSGETIRLRVCRHLFFWGVNNYRHSRHPVPLPAITHLPKVPSLIIFPNGSNARWKFPIPSLSFSLGPSSSSIIRKR
jgi:hypothetical protein